MAGVEILRNCLPYKEAIIWYDECLIHYSNLSFFSTTETDPPFYMWNVANATQPDKFNEILGKTFSNWSIVATSNPLNHILLDGKNGRRGLAPSCNLRYELYTFLLDLPVTAQPPGPNRP
ncbi:hypothetical protein ACSBR2_015996 [Camellia fascicularis]